MTDKAVEQFKADQAIFDRDNAMHSCVEALRRLREMAEHLNNLRAYDDAERLIAAMDTVSAIGADVMEKHGAQGRFFKDSMTAIMRAVDDERRVIAVLREREAQRGGRTH